MFVLIRKMFVILLTSIVNVSNNAKCIFLSNQQCKTQHNPINLHPNDYSQGLRYYPFTVNLDRYAGSCNTLDEPSNGVCVPKKQKI